MSQVATAEASELFDVILERTCVGLQITKTQYEDAEGKYEAVCRWLSKDESPVARYNPHLYPQGSLKIDTTVRPVGQAEFDLDLVCQLDIRHRVDPSAVFDLIWKRLEANGTYRELIEAKRRCIRINYAGQFHLDVVPAVPDVSQGGSCIYVPDLPNPTLKFWKPSNPVGYAEWFNKQVAKRPRVVKFAANEAKSYDPLNRPKPAHLKRPLQLAVQLYKRWRDIEFADRMEMAPPSIILTTLSGHYYEGEEEYAEALGSILHKTVEATRRGRLELFNPVNDRELISERWAADPGSYIVFAEAVTAFRDRWVDLVRSRGVATITAELKQLFGEQAEMAVKEAFAP